MPLGLTVDLGWEQQCSRAVVACLRPGTATIPRCRYNDSDEATLSGGPAALASAVPLVAAGAAAGLGRLRERHRRLP